MKDKLTIGLVRRGYSPSGGAEAYLKRLALGLVKLGHATPLLTSKDWPRDEWSFGEISRVDGRSAIRFADEVEKQRARLDCDVIMSLERLWRCDVYRAGDGVHQAWLDRRRRFEWPGHGLFRRFNRKHKEILRLEQCLFGERTAEYVIANSKMVKDEIFDLYSYRPDKIDMVRNGIPLDQFRIDPAAREKTRTELGVQPDDVVALFAGSGWERKGLRYAIEAVKISPVSKLRLLVAGRGDATAYPTSDRIHFLGEIANLAPIYAGADIFILPTIYDPFSNACLEALACGLPVITTRANGFSEIIEDRIHGWIVDAADDIRGLRSALEIWSDSTQRAAARPSILKRASQFDIAKNVEQTITVLLKAAKTASG